MWPFTRDKGLDSLLRHCFHFAPGTAGDQSHNASRLLQISTDVNFSSNRLLQSTGKIAQFAEKVTSPPQLDAFPVKKWRPLAKLKGLHQPYIVPKRIVNIQREVRAIYREPCVHRQFKLLIQWTGNRPDALPEHPMVHNEEIRPCFDGLLENRQAGING